MGGAERERSPSKRRRRDERREEEERKRGREEGVARNHHQHHHQHGDVTATSAETRVLVLPSGAVAGETAWPRKNSVWRYWQSYDDDERCAASSSCAAAAAASARDYYCERGGRDEYREDRHHYRTPEEQRDGHDIPEAWCEPSPQERPPARDHQGSDFPVL